MSFYLPTATNDDVLQENTLPYYMDLGPVWLLMGNIFMLLTRKLFRGISSVTKLLQLLYVNERKH